MNTDTVSKERLAAAGVFAAALFLCLALAWAAYVAARTAGLNAYTGWYPLVDITMFVPPTGTVWRFAWLVQLPFAMASLLAVTALRLPDRWRIPGSAGLVLAGMLVLLTTLTAAAGLVEWQRGQIVMLFGIITTPAALAVLIWVRSTRIDEEPVLGDPAMVADATSMIVLLAGVSLALYALVVDIRPVQVALSIVLLAWYLILAASLFAEYARLRGDHALRYRASLAALGLVAIMVAAGIWLVWEASAGSPSLLSMLWAILALSLLPAAIAASTYASANSRGWPLPLATSAVIGVLAFALILRIHFGARGSATASAGVFLVLIPATLAIAFSKRDEAMNDLDEEEYTDETGSEMDDATDER
jgi:hypothetical protein